MNRVLLSAKGLCKSYQGQKKENLILDHVNLELFAGDFTVVMGPSGAGKSTLLYLLSGMDSASDGEVSFFSTEQMELGKLTEKQMAALRTEKFGFVFQQTHLVSNLSIEENVLVAGYNNKNTPAAQVRERTNELLQRMHIEGIKDHLPGQSSGGEAQRAAIARALINQPELLFADEPTGALNRANTEGILDIFSELHAGGQSILMVTHDWMAAARGNRILYMEDGSIAGELNLPVYHSEKKHSREETVSQWLRKMELLGKGR
ncbi:MAG: ABC transporter ATP-binding protein [Clostridiales bacterium]|nr:ABC transporter ATP-binding protein [Clostridiales bacterium]